MDHLYLLDWLVIIASLIVTFGVGIWTSHSIKQSSDFFLSGRKLGPLLQFFINFGQMTDSAGAPQLATFIYQGGVSGVWASFQTLFLTPFYWFTSIWFRRTRLVTGSDLFVDRFNSVFLGRAYAWYFALLIVPLYLGLGNVVSYKAAASMFTKPESEYTDLDKKSVASYQRYLELKEEKKLHPLVGDKAVEFQKLDDLKREDKIHSVVSYFSPFSFYIGYTLFVSVYIMMGGIKGAAYADAMQGLLILMLSAVLLPFGLYQVGGFEGLHRAINNPSVFTLIDNPWSLMGWFVVASYVLNGLAAAPAPTWITNNAAAKNEMSLRVGMLGGGFSKRLVMIAWIFCSLLCLALVPGISDPDMAWGQLSEKLLPPGLLGLMVVGLLIGHMPLVAVAAVNFSATFTRNIYQELLPNRSPKHYLAVAQFSVFGVLVVGALIAMGANGIREIYDSLLTINPFAGAVAWLIYFWRGLSTRAVMWGAVVWFVIVLLLPWGSPFLDVISKNAALTREDADGTPLFFEQVVHTNPADLNSPMEGHRRFQVETWFCYEIGIPVDKLPSNQLKVVPILFTAISPFFILIILSALMPDRRVKSIKIPEQITEAEMTAIRAMIDGNYRVLPRENETPEEAELRIRRFYAKMMTPIGASPEADAQALARSFREPDWYKSWKLFQNSDWELTWLSRGDALGFFGSCALVFAILILILFLLKIGS